MDQIFIGAHSDDVEQKETMLLKFANRHGLIAGATGTGKTVTLQGLIEEFSRHGVPVLLADIKGDLSSLAAPSQMPTFIKERAAKISYEKEFSPQSFPVRFWDIFGKDGIPLRTTITEVGPILLSRMLGLNETQEGVLNIAFRVADEDGLLLLDIKDLRALLNHIAENASTTSASYGNISKASIGAIQRSILVLEDQGADKFFGEPSIALTDFMDVDKNGNGIINILAADKLVHEPRLYASFMLWLMSELFEEMPEVGDAEKPKLVFFFDEAHLLFDNAPKSLLTKIEQVIKLIRSKGIGIYFVTQNPADIPESILSQLGNRMQHALRAFTPKQQKDIKLAAQTYRPNENFDVEDVITSLGIGEALVSTLDAKGHPSIVQKTLIRPPFSMIGVLPEEEKIKMLDNDILQKKYGKEIDRISAYEILKTRADKDLQTPEKTPKPKNDPSPKTVRRDAPQPSKKSNRQTPTEAFIKSMARQFGSQLSREIIRGVMGSLKR
jgi:DNA helicase HerA-like ATPase